MDLVCVCVVFLVLIGISGCNNLTTAVNMTVSPTTTPTIIASSRSISNVNTTSSTEIVLPSDNATDSTPGMKNISSAATSETPTPTPNIIWTIPSSPRNVTVIVEGNVLIVSWLPPEYPYGEIKHYIVSWRRSNRSENYMKENVPSSPFTIRQLEEFTSYSIKVQAVNNVGIGNSSDPVLAKTTQAESSYLGVIVIITVAIFFFILVLIALLILQRKILKRQHNKLVREFETWYSMNRMEGQEPESQPNATAQTDQSEELSYVTLLMDWEITPDNLNVLEKNLGKGKFGIVKQGLLKTGECDPEVVAVKMLKDGASESDLSDLLSELDILKEINKIPHPNVIRFIGGCSIAGNLHVVIEFCPGGNLRNLLLNSRVGYPSPENSSNYINMTSTLNHRQLLKIAVDISNGMVHLSSQKFIHRDLAARNILIGEDDIAKVSDFGLARNISGAEEYIRNNQNLLPVKWMALESLLHGRFTTASDVWSYGILLHEIVTLGEEPYKNISPYNIVIHVGSGCRMSQPSQCSDELYEIIRNCWKVEPSERSTFEDLHESLHGMLMHDEKSYINITQVVNEGSLTTTMEPRSLSGEDGSANA